MSTATVAAPVKKEQTTGTPAAETQKGIDNHKAAAKHLTEAAKHHTEAAKHHEDGNHEKAAVSSIKATGHTEIAKGHQKEDAKQHAMSTTK